VIWRAITVSHVLAPLNHLTTPFPPTTPRSDPLHIGVPGVRTRIRDSLSFLCVAWQPGVALIILALVIMRHNTEVGPYIKQQFFRDREKVGKEIEGGSKGHTKKN